MIAENYKGSIVGLFLSKPPVLTLIFKDKEIGHWMLDKPVFKIGRAPDNDIVIDNPAVSRLHSLIEEDERRRISSRTATASTARSSTRGASAGRF